MTEPRKITEQLVDLRSVRVRTDLPKKERMADYLEKIGDPANFRVGKYVVHLAFAEGGPSAQQVFTGLIRSKSACG